MTRRERRVAALGAVALLAARRSELPVALAALAADDAQLRRALGGLPRRLAAGLDLAAALATEGLVDGVERGRIAAAGGDPAPLLRELAERSACQPAAPFLLAWWPVWVALAAAGPALAVVAAGELLGGGGFRSLSHLADSLGGLLTYPPRPPAAPAPVLVLSLAGLALALAGLAVVWHTLLRSSWGGAALALLAPSAWRAHLFARLVHHARCDDDGITARSCWRWWTILCARPIALAQARRAAGGDLAATLAALHLLPAGPDGRPDWNAAARAATRDQQEREREAEAPLVAALILAGIAGFALFALWSGGGGGLLTVFEVQKTLGSPGLQVAGWLPVAARAWAIALVVVGATAVAGLLQLLVRGWDVLAGERTAWRLVAAALADTCRRGDDAAPVVAALSFTAPWPVDRRLERLAFRLRHGEPDLAQALVAEGIVPPAARPLALAAQAAGRAAWVAWLAAEASRPGALGEQAARLRAQALCVLVVLGVPLAVLAAASQRKLLGMARAIAGDYSAGGGSGNPLQTWLPSWCHWLVAWIPWPGGTPRAAPPPGLQAALVAVLPSPNQAMALLVAVVAAVALAAARGWLPWQRQARRHQLAAALLAMPGADEGALGRVVAAARPQRRVQALGAGACGDLGGVLRAAGWRLDGLPALALALERDRRSLERRTAWWLAAGAAGISLLAGLVVALSALLVWSYTGGWMRMMLTVAAGER